MHSLRPMLKADVNSVIEVIDSHDEDDAAEARDGFDRPDGLEDQYVLEQQGRIIGVTGFATPPGCDQTHWLSWTYVHSDLVNQGIGRAMVTELIEHLNQAGGRKLFIKISDYSETDESGNEVCIYDAALHLYKSLGFKEEMTLKDYYDQDENMTILGLRFNEPESSVSSAGLEKHKIQFNAIFEIAETDDAYSFGWEAKAKRTFDSSDVQLGIEDVRGRDGRAIFLSFPHNYAGLSETLFSAGFSNAGLLEDYFEDGIHEQHFSYYF